MNRKGRKNSDSETVLGGAPGLIYSQPIVHSVSASPRRPLLHVVLKHAYQYSMDRHTYPHFCHFVHIYLKNLGLLRAICDLLVLIPEAPFLSEIIDFECI